MHVQRAIEGLFLAVPDRRTDLFESSQRDAAGGGNALTIGHQAMGHAHPIGNELPAIHLSVGHAGVLILLLVGPP